MALTATYFLNDNPIDTKKKNAVSFLSSGAISKLASQYQQGLDDSSAESENNGGLVGGTGYLLEKVGLDFYQALKAFGITVLAALPSCSVQTIGQNGNLQTIG